MLLLLFFFDKNGECYCDTLNFFEIFNEFNIYSDSDLLIIMVFCVYLKRAIKSSTLNRVW